MPSDKKQEHLASLIISIIILIIVIILIIIVCYNWNISNGTNANDQLLIKNPQVLAAAAIYNKKKSVYKSQYSNIPIFQYSNIPIFQYSNM